VWTPRARQRWIVMIKKIMQQLSSHGRVPLPGAAHKEKRALRPRVLVSPNRIESLFVITDLSDFRWKTF